MLTRRFFLGLLSATVALGKDGESYKSTHTDGFANGRMWKMLDGHYQRLFLNAYCDGLGMLKVMVDDDVPGGKKSGEIWETVLRALPRNITLGELQDSIDALYKEPSDAALPIGFMIMIVTAKTRGSSADQIAKALDAGRAIYLNL